MEGNRLNPLVPAANKSNWIDVQELPYNSSRKPSENLPKIVGFVFFIYLPTADRFLLIY